MGPLSNLLKRSEIFKEQFDRIFPDETFNKVNILKYITECIGILLTEARDKYPDHGIRFINPLFIVDREIFPASNLPGDAVILKFTPQIFDLVQSKTIIPFSLPIIDNLLSGICLFHGNIEMPHDYKLFKTFNLNILPNIESVAGEINEDNIAAKIINLSIRIQKYPASFVALSNALGSNSEEEKVTLIKTLLLYKSMANTLDHSLAYSFINKYNATRSFFDCLLTVVSEQPFDEDELLDFAHIAESIALPIANYDYNKSKGISAHTMAKRNSLKSVMEDIFRHVETY